MISPVTVLSLASHAPSVLDCLLPHVPVVLVVFFHTFQSSWLSFSTRSSHPGCLPHVPVVLSCFVSHTRFVLALPWAVLTTTFSPAWAVLLEALSLPLRHSRFTLCSFVGHSRFTLCSFVGHSRFTLCSFVEHSLHPRLSC